MTIVVVVVIINFLKTPQGPRNWLGHQRKADGTVIPKQALAGMGSREGEAGGFHSNLRVRGLGRAKQLEVLLSSLTTCGCISYLSTGLCGQSQSLQLQPISLRMVSGILATGPHAKPCRQVQLFPCLLPHFLFFMLSFHKSNPPPAFRAHNQKVPIRSLCRSPQTKQGGEAGFECRQPDT